MEQFWCETCGREHAGLPLDLGFDYPADFFRIPAPERERRITYNGDLCFIDRQEYYARGILALPIRDSDQEFRWGVWARIEKASVRRYRDLWDSDDATKEPRFPGVLSGGVPAYPNTDSLAVEVQLVVRKRPRFFVVDGKHPLGIAQREGVSWHEVHGFVDRTFGSG